MPMEQLKQSSDQSQKQDQTSFNALMKNILKNRVLWFDGEVSFTPDQLAEFILNGGQITDGIHITALNEEIMKFKKFNPSLVLNVKKELNHLDKTWNIPEKYKSINIKEYIKNSFLKEIEEKRLSGSELSDAEVNKRIDRISQEVKLYEQNDMNIILRTIIYILDVFKQNGVVWGTGRGSSCSSYVLYLLGLHSVDSVEYELDIKEFFK